MAKSSLICGGKEIRKAMADRVIYCVFCTVLEHAVLLALVWVQSLL